jgi:NAD(P)-dependent dehydrogenase (short-subunit alcohol dehydrogenase family)
VAGRLEGKVVIVTGAARGMGAAEARLFASEGAAVVLADVREQLGIAVADEIAAAGGLARFVAMDVAHEDDWSRGGSIVNVSSVMAFLGGEGGGAAAYGASKGALTTLTKGAAMELGRDRIRVNSLHPGNVDTPLALEAAGPPGSAARQAMARMSPFEREGASEELAAAALFLISDESSFMTGSEMVVDGGYAIH